MIHPLEGGLYRYFNQRYRILERLGRPMKKIEQTKTKGEAEQRYEDVVRKNNRVSSMLNHLLCNPNIRITLNRTCSTDGLFIATYKKLHGDEITAESTSLEGVLDRLEHLVNLSYDLDCIKKGG